MEEYPMVHRSAIVVIPIERFLNWINKIDTFETLSLSEVQKDNNVYLIPDSDQPINTDDLDNEIENYIKNHFKSIFYNQLSEWYLDVTTYSKMTYENFKDWFKISTQAVIFDMVNKPKKKESSR